ncbi:hypothetical protein F5146DRAFT_1006439 [Armillaria mellea]|nr:hypothetical protein F5146DRAFT_1006439 [Armillaria mellea]
MRRMVLWEPMFPTHLRLAQPRQGKMCTTYLPAWDVLTTILHSCCASEAKSSNTRGIDKQKMLQRPISSTKAKRHLNSTHIHACLKTELSLPIRVDPQVGTSTVILDALGCLDSFQPKPTLRLQKIMLDEIYASMLAFEKPEPKVSSCHAGPVTNQKLRKLDGSLLSRDRNDTFSESHHQKRARYSRARLLPCAAYNRTNYGTKREAKTLLEEPSLEIAKLTEDARGEHTELQTSSSCESLSLIESRTPTMCSPALHGGRSFVLRRRGAEATESQSSQWYPRAIFVSGPAWHCARREPIRKENFVEMLKENSHGAVELVVLRAISRNSTNSVRLAAQSIINISKYLPNITRRETHALIVYFGLTARTEINLRLRTLERPVAADPRVLTEYFSFLAARCCNTQRNSHEKKDAAHQLPRFVGVHLFLSIKYATPLVIPTFKETTFALTSVGTGLAKHAYFPACGMMLFRVKVQRTELRALNLPLNPLPSGCNSMSITTLIVLGKIEKKKRLDPSYRKGIETTFCRRTEGIQGIGMIRDGIAHGKNIVVDNISLVDTYLVCVRNSRLEVKENKCFANSLVIAELREYARIEDKNPAGLDSPLPSIPSMNCSNSDSQPANEGFRRMTVPQSTIQFQQIYCSNERAKIGRCDGEHNAWPLAPRLPFGVATPATYLVAIWTTVPKTRPKLDMQYRMPAMTIITSRLKLGVRAFKVVLDSASIEMAP